MLGNPYGLAPAKNTFKAEGVWLCNQCKMDGVNVPGQALWSADVNVVDGVLTMWFGGRKCVSIFNVFIDLLLILFSEQSYMESYAIDKRSTQVAWFTVDPID